MPSSGRESRVESRGSPTFRLSTLVARLSTVILLLACSTPDSTIVRVVVPTRPPLRIPAHSLKNAGVVKSSRLFRVLASVRGRDKRIRPGTYQFKRGASWTEVLEALRAGKGIVHTVTIPEGFSISQIAPLVAEKLNVPADSV